MMHEINRTARSKTTTIRSGGPRTLAERFADLCAEHRVPRAFGAVAARLLDEVRRRGLAEKQERATALAEAAARPPMTDEEIAEQRASWVRGEMGMAEAERADGSATRMKL